MWQAFCLLSLFPSTLEMLCLSQVNTGRAAVRLWSPAVVPGPALVLKLLYDGRAVQDFCRLFTFVRLSLVL